MPWFPDFVAAAELVRRQSRAAGQADPVAQYLKAMARGDPHAWLAERHASAETVASTHAGGRAVVELLARLSHEKEEVLWPLAVVAESPNDRSVVFRTYCSQWPVDGRRPVRGPILEPGSPVDRS
jgi:hypothetical protein